MKDINMKKIAFFPLALLSFPAWAHTGMDGAQHHFVAGFSHPLGGLDHSLAMIAVGLVAAFLGGKARTMLPGAFLLAMLAGFGLGAGRIVDLPAYEAMILASVIGLGLALLVARPLPLPVSLGITALFGLAHGFAHGVEGVLTSGYVEGFLAATALLHAVGLSIGYGVARLERPVLYRLAGAGMAAAGLVLAMA
jgi:urease accessory protein